MTNFQATSGEQTLATLREEDMSPHQHFPGQRNDKISIYSLLFGSRHLPGVFLIIFFRQSGFSVAGSCFIRRPVCLF